MKGIRTRQNEDWMLRIQYSARLFFNQAEKLGRYVWVAAFAAELCIFLPESVPLAVQCLLPSLFCLAELVLACCFNRKVEDAARLRNYFDAYVLNLGLSDYKAEEILACKELSMTVSERHSKEADVQMSNSGRDDPPGVKDWYEFGSTIEGDAAVYNCQKQNRWWNNQLATKRIWRSLGSIVFFFVLFAVVAIIFPQGVWKVIGCSVGLALRAAERLWMHVNYYTISRKIDTTVEIMDRKLHKDQLLVLQEMIADRRKIPVLESNRLHKIHATPMSVRYEKLTK